MNIPLIAIHPDDYTAGAGAVRDAAASGWAELVKARGGAVRMVDAFAPDILDQVKDCTGFMWRFLHLPSHRAVARRLLPVLEDMLGLAVWPNQQTCWHYDDKIAQALMFSAAGIPSPQTWIFWREADARRFLATATYPLVLKLASGAGSSRVFLVRSISEATAWVELMFTSGLTGADEVGSDGRLSWKSRVRRALAAGGWRRSEPHRVWWENHGQYLLVQEFLLGNDFDTRVTVIGRKAFACRRFNRPGDFRASGSPKRDLDPARVDQRFVRLAFQIAQATGCESCAIDGLYRAGECVVSEISYTFVTGVIDLCPGHWVLSGEPLDGELNWVEGSSTAEEAQMEVFWPRVLEAAERLKRRF